MNSERDTTKNCALFLLSIFYLPFKCLTCGLCVVWFRNNALCIQSGFLLLQKEAKTINLIKIAQEARWKWGGGGRGGVVAGFDQDANKYMTSIGISYLVISFAL